MSKPAPDVSWVHCLQTGVVKDKARIRLRCGLLCFCGLRLLMPPAYAGGYVSHRYAFWQEGVFQTGALFFELA